jgi:hypothetical protein
MATHDGLRVETPQPWGVTRGQRGHDVESPIRLPVCQPTDVKAPVNTVTFHQHGFLNSIPSEPTCSNSGLIVWVSLLKIGEIPRFQSNHAFKGIASLTVKPAFGP